MFFYTYIIVSPSGKYYIGRHSTHNIHDGYMGSGKWVKSIKDKSTLKKTILQWCEDEYEVKAAEQQLLDTHIGLTNCMNFNNRSSGWSIGDLHPSKTVEAREKMRTKNPAKTKQSREKISQSSKHLVKIGVIKTFADCEVQQKAIETKRKKFATGELFISDEHKEKLSQSARNQPKLECPHCGKIASLSNAKGYHFDRCKLFSTL